MLLDDKMSWPERSVQGFALAATIADDPRAAAAYAGLAPAVADQATRVARELAGMDSAARRRRIRGLVRSLSEPLESDPPLAPRARALLARVAPKHLGGKWLQAAPAPRPGFTPEPALIALVRRIAANRAPRRNQGET